ncbi:phytosulfokines 3-like [Curcuma longa]|uniref:phytosulfokines 3-like n=1 Tax=Curcuma longa TaxID=136217 RepID=UPI003D9DE1AC
MAFSSKNIMFLLVALLFVSLVHAGRSGPIDHHPKEDNFKGLEKEVMEEKVEGCGNGEEEDECLMRRTLVAHTDYIYTQEKHG